MRMQWLRCLRWLRWMWLVALPASAAASGGYELAVLKGTWHSLRLGYAAEGANKALRVRPPADAAFVAGSDAIEAFDWDRQVLTLTPAASAALLKAIDASERSIGPALNQRAFAVRLTGAYRYGGIFLDAVSQMAIGYPVARVRVFEGRVRIALLPLQIPFAEEDLVDGRGARRPPIAAEAARAGVDRLRAEPDKGIEQWMDGLAASPAATASRAMLRAEDIRAALAASGKLRPSQVR